ncbi:sulfite exporter TauE/SafE family protein [Maritalea mediterranea]|uniref:Probable membrane transporter protein n=1 Tax=Maritalea mediterranea TaxID=2909667 RepID=A0ABS9E7W9_9HYPH|nr:sulfite exporter TauE/SafE family protein [Maritalea mediterranea]MCF4098980.1 sulfite exporter TauE/SafE family protein [Maritalea mediterranea]
MDFLTSLLVEYGALGLAGVAAGIIAGLLGVGGGIVMVPVMSVIFAAQGMEEAVILHVAVATSLAVIVPTGLSSALAHHRKGAVSGELLKLWAPSMVAASFLGGISAGFYSSLVMRLIFGVMAILIAVNSVVPIQKKLMAHLSDSAKTHRISAAVIGYISSLMGIGGGSLSVPTMAALGRKVHQAVGTSSALGVFIAVPGALGFVLSGWGVGGVPNYALGYIYLPAFLALAVGAILFAPLGAAIAHKLSGEWLKRVLTIYLLIVGVRMILKAIGG